MKDGQRTDWLRLAAAAAWVVVALGVAFFPVSFLYAGLNLECVETQSCDFLGDPDGIWRFWLLDLAVMLLAIGVIALWAWRRDGR